jgi:hypothetical protein
MLNRIEKPTSLSAIVVGSIACMGHIFALAGPNTGHGFIGFLAASMFGAFSVPPFLLMVVLLVLNRLWGNRRAVAGTVLSALGSFILYYWTTHSFRFTP